MSSLRFSFLLVVFLSLPSLACDDLFLNIKKLTQISQEKNDRRIEELKKIPVTKEMTTKAGGEIITSRTGLADVYEVIESDGVTVYRHYTTKEAAVEIRSTGILMAGPRPSAITLNSSLEINPDIYGVFFTQAVDSPRAPKDLVALDFTIPEGYKIVKTFQDEFVIPGPRPIQPWLLKEVSRNPEAYPHLMSGLKKNASGEYELKEEPLKIYINAL